MGYKPFYIVDGQQRLITAIILIQAIIEIWKGKGNDIKSRSLDDIRKKFILHKHGEKESFLLGYEEDDPSDEFLKTKILELNNNSSLDHNKTLYTRNLNEAKKYFKKQLKGLKKPDHYIPELYQKLTQKLKFNLYEIKLNDEIDVFVTFETMNNRGKKLTSLELLKNRLMYLSTLLKIDDSNRGKLREEINNVWKTVYQFLGKNPDYPLDEEEFLQNHWIMYFTYSRSEKNPYIKFLLDTKFTAKNINHLEKKDEQITVEEDIKEYISSLKQSVEQWFYIHNPRHSDNKNGNEKTKKFLERLNRLTFWAFRPLLLAAFISHPEKEEQINSLLEAMENYIFTIFSISQRRSDTGTYEFYIIASELLKDLKTIPEIINQIKEKGKYKYDCERFFKHINDKYKDGGGFYSWRGLRYFLYEYEEYLRGKYNPKLDWKELKLGTVEHILPQTIKDITYWENRYDKYTDEEKNNLTHSLGNLLPLSGKKNSALKNFSFPEKRNKGERIGYYNGSYSEIEVAEAYKNEDADWLADDILKRGMKLLKFMEERWDIKLGDDDFKVKLLHLDFLTKGKES